jgi:predicted transposase YdaD
MIDHDRLFKELLTTFFTDFVDLLLPDLSAYLDPRSLEFLDKEVFTDVTEGERHEADIVVRARFRSEASCFLVHVENQAQSQPEFARRMFRYFARLHERHALPVYPIVVFSHDSTRPEPDRYGVSFPDLDVLRFQFRSIQLRRLHWRDYLRRPNPVAAALMARMGMAEEERPRVKLECLRLLTTLRLDPARMKLISGFIDTYLRLNREETLRFEREADTVLTTNEKTTMLELTTSWKEEGRQEGRQEGRREESLRLILRLLHRRFGTLPADAEARVRALSLEQAEALAEALLDFTSLADLANWLRSQ